MPDFHGFDKLPAGATGKPVPFELHVPEAQLADMKTLLRLSPIGPETYVNTVSRLPLEHDLNYGVRRDWLVAAKETWLERFDWRAHEAHLNSFPNFTMNVQGPHIAEPLRVHFAALFSAKKGAPPVIFMHGWPGSLLEFVPMLTLLRAKYTADTLPFHAIVPSLPGYGASDGPPLAHDYSSEDLAKSMHQLMLDLGFGSGYIAQGGDVGSNLAKFMSHYDECKAFHVNLLFETRDDEYRKNMDERETRIAHKGDVCDARGMAYAFEHGTRPATVGLALSASPLALLVWMAEKFLEWSDPDCMELDHILLGASFYWLTSTFARSIYTYRHDFVLGGFPKPNRTTPMGYSAFEDVHVLPKALSKNFPNMVFRKDHTKGGHFAALENPKDFMEDVVEFVQIIGRLA